MHNAGHSVLDLYRIRFGPFEIGDLQEERCVQQQRKNGFFSTLWRKEPPEGIARQENKCSTNERMTLMLFLYNKGFIVTVQGKTLFITGGSRGIGKAIALRAAQDGANVMMLQKQPNHIQNARHHLFCWEVEAAGGKALPCVVDIRKEGVEKRYKAIETFGGIDILVDNASAIQLTGTLQTPMKRYDLMHSVNVRGTYLTSQNVFLICSSQTIHTFESLSTAEYGCQMV